MNFQVSKTWSKERSDIRQRVDTPLVPSKGWWPDSSEELTVAARTPVVYFSQRLNRSSALSTRQKGSGHPQGRRQERTVSAFSTGGPTWSQSVRPATNAGAPAERIDARQDPTNEWRTDSSEVSPTPANTALERSLCLSVTSRAHLTVDDARSTQLSLATGARWERIALSDLRQSKTQTQSHSGIPPSSALTGKPKTAKKEVSGHPKEPAQNPFVPFSSGVEARSPSSLSERQAGAPANGSSRSKPDAIG